MEENNNKPIINDFIYCPSCGTKNDKSYKYCSKCSKPLPNNKNDDVILCPKCGSRNVEFVTYQASSNFDKGDACCGYLLCGPIGLLFGAKDKTEAKTVRKCKKCGHEF